MSIQIKEVLNKKDLKKWVDFPNKMYKKVPEFVPFLFADEMSTFTQGKNPALEFCETRQFLAYKDGKIVGRIAGIINNAANEKWGTNYIRFSRFDFIDNYEVSKALFDTVVAWGKERGFTGIIGPIGFTDMDHEGMLIEGYEEFNMSMTFYNFPYYLEHMNKLKLEKEIDWIEYQVFVPDKPNEKLDKLSQFIEKRNGYQLVTYTDRKVLAADAFEAFKVIDEAFAVLYGSVPLTDAVINQVLKDYIPLIHLDYICAVKDKEGKIAGFAILAPSLAKAQKKSNGRLFPLGIFRMLKALKCKNDTLEMWFIAVKPEHQKKGLPAILVNQLIKACIKNGVKICESGPELEINEGVQALWKDFKVRQHKRRRCFKKEI